MKLATDTITVYNSYTDNIKKYKHYIPTDVGELQVAYAQHTKKIAELEAEISKLKKQKAKAKD